jgi:hypothetical protein
MPGGSPSFYSFLSTYFIAVNWSGGLVKYFGTAVLPK